MTKVYTLSNGIKIKTANSNTGYHGAHLNQSGSYLKSPFIAHVSQRHFDSLDDSLKVHPKSHTPHVGYYEDSREAAYAAAFTKKFTAEAATLLKKTSKRHAVVEFPDDLYDLPVFMTADEAKESIAEENANLSVTTLLSGNLMPITTKKFNPRGRADQALEKYGNGVFMKIAKYYSKDVVKSVRTGSGWTLAEFEAYFEHLPEDTPA